MKSNRGSNDCPTSDQLRAAIQGRLTNDEQQMLVEHLNTCSDCQRHLEQLSGASEFFPAEPIQSHGSPSNALLHVMNRLRRQEPKIIEDVEIVALLEPSEDHAGLGRFGSYDVIDILGKGGMGIVFKAYDSSLARVVAIKVLQPRLAVSAEARQRFVREAQAAAAVIHENVVTIHAVDEWRELPYFVMEYVEGQSLQERIHPGALDLEETLRIATQVCSGLSAAHEQGLVHRDIKPANILLQNGVARVKITDFGLAKAVDDVSLTRTGTIAGTPQYLSPEQADSTMNVDHRTDLFSLGGVLYAMCTGRPPFVGDSAARIIRQVCDEQPRPIEKLNEQTPAWLSSIVRKLLEKDPRRRYSSADDVKAALKQQLLETQAGVSRGQGPWLRRVVIVASILLLAGGGWRIGQVLVSKNDDLTPASSQSSDETDLRVYRVSSSANRFASLAKAIENTEPGGAIDIEGDGPYDITPVFLDKAVTIRAAQGSRPVLRMTQGRSGLATNEDLRLEGLRIQGEVESGFVIRNPSATGIVKCRGSRLEIIDCEIDSEGISGISFGGAHCKIENSAIRTSMAFSVGWFLEPDAELRVENSVLAGHGSLSFVRSTPLNESKPARLKLSHTTLVANMGMRYGARTAMTQDEDRTRLGDPPTLVIAAHDCVFDTERLLLMVAPTRFLPRPDNMERILVTILDWTEQNNYYRDSMEMVVMQVFRQKNPLFGDNDLAHWHDIFGVTDSQTTSGTVEYQNSEDFVIKTFSPEPRGGLTPGHLHSERKP